LKILIVTTDPNKSGGVANYYKTLLGNFSFDVEYFIQGSRTDKDGFFSDINRLVSDYKIFKKQITENKYDLILLNPSMDFKSVVRDSKFIQLSKKHSSAKLILFWRGFILNFFDNYIEKKFTKLFASVFFKADAHIVLGTIFKDRLQNIGCTSPIYCETTIVGNDFFKKGPKVFSKERLNILFLARVEKTKGIYEAIDAYNIVKKKYAGAFFTIAGNGFEYGDAKNYVEKNEIKDVTFLGDVRGQAKINVLENADVYLFPSYFEGMPNSVLEAMAMGIPVVTTNVGGLADFFKNEKMGYISNSCEPDILAGYIEKLFLDVELRKQISKTNIQYAKENFSLSVVLKRLENVFNKVSSVKIDSF
jgi:glycosyltransferase involved in cell wall biosynthesis